jgi:hypothetical protein
MCIMHSDGKPALACEFAHTFVVGVQLQREHDGDDDDDGDGRDVDGRIHKKGKPSPTRLAVTTSFSKPPRVVHALTMPPVTTRRY